MSKKKSPPNFPVPCSETSYSWLALIFFSLDSICPNASEFTHSARGSARALHRGSEIMCGEAVWVTHKCACKYFSPLILSCPYVHDLSDLLAASSDSGAVELFLHLKKMIKFLENIYVLYISKPLGRLQSWLSKNPFYTGFQWLIFSLIFINALIGSLKQNCNYNNYYSHFLCTYRCSARCFC